MVTQIKSFQIDPQTLDFDLPEDRIAQEPLAVRDRAKMMVLNRAEKSLGHFQFRDLASFLNKGDVLVMNTAKVSHAKLIGVKSTGGKVEVILIGPVPHSQDWKALVRPEMKVGTHFNLGPGTDVELVSRTDIGENILKFHAGDPESLMVEAGRIPLPPYIKRGSQDPRGESDEIYYQTVYAKESGSLAAPTAGLHFTENLLNVLDNLGIHLVKVLLHVGWGTFKPISQSLDSHVMLSERYELSADAINQLYSAKSEGRRIVAVGTTATRILESLPDKKSECASNGETSIFIRPGHKFRWVNSLVTNFHVPRSTPVSLTAAFTGMEFLESAYATAIHDQYRFFSYGDAMLIL